MPGDDRPCLQCGVKRAQWPRGLCRACDRAQGTYVAPVHVPRRTCRRCGVEAETRESLCGPCWQQVDAAHAPAGAGTVVVVRERVIERRVYLVVWDGGK